MPRYVVLLKNENTPALQRRQNQPDEVVGLLRENHKRNNEKVRNQLGGRKDIEIINDFWINDSLVVETRSPQALEHLRRLNIVDGIEEEAKYELTGAPVETELQQLNDTAELTWGLADVGADRVWSEFGITGKNVRAGVCDTGIRATHEALRNRLVTTNTLNNHFPGGWADFNMDGTHRWVNPRDGHGHGTHVAGTISGGKASTNGRSIGVAPDAKIIAAGLFNGSGATTDARVMAALQWTLDPTYQGTKTNTAPRVVNNSWGAAGWYGLMYVSIVAAYEAAGILFVASSGNDGINTSGSPGHDWGVLAVGATAANRGATSFSSGAVIGKHQFTGGTRPPHWPHGWVVPSISAPGAAVWSATDEGDMAYNWWNGTSMACPHVVGVAALMLEANPNLTPKQIRTIMRQTADWDDRHRAEPDRDTRFGAGRVNAYRAVKAVLS